MRIGVWRVLPVVLDAVRETVEWHLFSNLGPDLEPLIRHELKQI
jgi:hypothetical protein